jgi:hypothetical protein
VLSRGVGVPARRRRRVAHVPSLAQGVRT